jgi:hypothetical protein
MEKKDFGSNSGIRLCEQKETCILIFKYIVHIRLLSPILSDNYRSFPIIWLFLKLRQTHCTAILGRGTQRYRRYYLPNYEHTQ